MTNEQLRTVDEFLGVKNLKTPDELRAELEFADRLDKFGFSRHPKTRRLFYRVPRFVTKHFPNISKKLQNY